VASLENSPLLIAVQLEIAICPGFELSVNPWAKFHAATQLSTITSQATEVPPSLNPFPSPSND
jgi:hypothetical protein